MILSNNLRCSGASKCGRRSVLHCQGAKCSWGGSQSRMKRTLCNPALCGIMRSSQQAGLCGLGQALATWRACGLASTQQLTLPSLQGALCMPAIISIRDESSLVTHTSNVLRQAAITQAAACVCSFLAAPHHRHTSRLQQ